MSNKVKGKARAAAAVALAAGVAASVGAQPAGPGDVGTAVWAAGAEPLAAESVVLDMRAGVDRAVRWHPLVRQAEGQLLQAGEGIDSARAGYYPQISGGVNSRTGNSDLTGYESRHVQRAEITLRQTLYDFGKVDSEVGRARASSDVARAGVLSSFDDVVRSTAQAWIEVRRQQALVKVAEEQLRALEELAGLARRRQTEGASTYSDTVQARARVEAAQVSLLTAQSQVLRWRTNLMNWVGGPVLPEVAGDPVEGLDGACQQAGAIQPWDAATSVSSASAVQEAEARLLVARAGADIAKSQERPTLSVDASLGRGLNSSSRRPGEPNAEAVVMLNFSMPFYQGGRLQADRRAAEYAVQSSRAALERVKLDTEQGLRDATLAKQENSRRITVQAAREESMRVTRALYRDQYLELGTRSLLDLLNAEQEYHAARSDQIDSEHNIYRSSIDCLYHAGSMRNVFGLEQVTAQALGSAQPLGLR